MARHLRGSDVRSASRIETSDERTDHCPNCTDAVSLTIPAGASRVVCSALFRHLPEPDLASVEFRQSGCDEFSHRALRNRGVRFTGKLIVPLMPAEDPRELIPFRQAQGAPL